ncbi:hypothetical protein SDC9_156076 [bioreactor metagenome]|uniref:Tyr recombinase domain-containing protein n=1 Tax=bioreactor metagenome TaxID=1076179 RepID=A0A645F3G5_9ZZZZ
MWGAYDKGETYAGYMLLMIYTGMMPGELLACKIESIDFSAQTITGAGLKTKERKSKPIVFPSFIAPVLRELIGDKLSGKLIRANRDAFYEQYHEAEARIGIRDLKPYSCRHTTATALAIGDAAAPGVIARVMRQTRPLTTQKYTHADVKAVLKVVNGMKKNPVTALPKGRGKKPNTGM